MPREQLTLHEAMQSILLDHAEQTATAQVLADENRTRDLYRMDDGDGPYPTPNQFRSRARRYPMFRLLGSDRVRYIRIAEERAAFLFSWNPENWSLENFLALRQRWLNNPEATEMWSSGNTTSIPKRARVFIINQGPDLPRGIVGSGWTDSDWYPKDGQNWNDLKFEILLNPQVDGLLTTDKLLDLSTTRWSVPASGISLSSDIAGPLEDRWAAYLSRIDRPARPVEESDAAAGSSLEGDRVLRSHLAAERDPELPRIKRALVLQQTGRLACEVCDFDFAETWGEIGEGISECHHTKPISHGKRRTRVADLAIVCANCHRIIHKLKPMPSITEIRELLTKQRN